MNYNKSRRQYRPVQEFTGQVVELMPKYKGVIQFQFENKKHRALLWYDKIRKCGRPLPEEDSIEDYVKKGTTLKFQAHTFDDSGIDRCAWYATSAWFLDEKDDLSIRSGLHHCCGSIQEIGRRRGTISFTSRGKEENIMFLGSKMYLSGKRVSTKLNLSHIESLDEGQRVMFDAVPCDTEDNNGQCSWFATVVWKGSKPKMEYDDKVVVRQKLSNFLPRVSEIRMVTSNPHSTFISSEGMVLKIINKEFGVALVSIKENMWETVLFHRTTVTLFNHKLNKMDLTRIFKQGDRLCIVAASAPKSAKLNVKWLASQIRVYGDPSNET